MIVTANEETRVKTDTGAATAIEDALMMAVDIGVTTGTGAGMMEGENIVLTTNMKISTGIERQEIEVQGAIEIARSMVDEPPRLLRAIPLMFTVMQPLRQNLWPVESPPDTLNGRSALLRADRLYQ